MPSPAFSVDLAAPVGQWRFSTAAPCERLAGIVKEFWEVQGTLLPFREKILPNGCAELMFNLGPPHTMTTAEGMSTWDHAWFSGLHDHAIRIESLSGTFLVSARLTPLGALRLFGSDLADTINRVVAIDWPLHSELAAANSTDARFALLEATLLARELQASSPFTEMAVRRIEDAAGNLRVSELHRDLAVSRKHLWSVFSRDMGMSPKAFARIQRFVATLEHLKSQESVEWATVAANAGYADQSHLARDFRRIADASPTEFLRTRSPDSTALLEEIPSDADRTPHQVR